MVVVTRDHQVRNRVVTLDEPVTADELGSIRNYINRNFSGWTLEAVRRELSGRLEHASAAYDDDPAKTDAAVLQGPARHRRAAPKFTWKAPATWSAWICI